MEWIDRLNSAIRYMEEHLTDEIDYEQLGRIACCSSWHFQRMFSYMAGIPLSEYIRRRKMSLAAVDLLSSDARIIDIAEKYGYRSPTAFNRAFQSIHGTAPSSVRQEGISVRSFPPITFKITVKGVEEMNYRIETKEAFRIVGVSVPLEKEIEKNFAVIPSKWQEISLNGTLQTLAQMMNQEPMGVLGVSTCNEEEPWRITSRSPLPWRQATMRNIPCPPQPGRSSPERAQTSPSRSWNGASSPNGFPPPDTNTETRRTSRST